MSTPYSNPGQNPYSGGPGMQRPGVPHQPQYGGGPNYAKVIAPAIALIVVGVLDILHSIFAVIVNTISLFNPELQRAQFQDQPFLEDFGPLINVVVAFTMMFLSGLLLFGAIMMLKRQNYAMAMTSAVIAIVPCTGIMTCCLVEIGIGIWALVVLMGEDVKRMFR